MPGVLGRLGIDYAIQGEADDIAFELFDGVACGSSKKGRDEEFFAGYQTFDSGFH